MSDDHAHALAVAEKLKQADETSAAAARSAFLEFWEQGCKHHFQVEETVVLPAWARHGAVDPPAIVQMLTEHIDLRRRAATSRPTRSRRSRTCTSSASASSATSSSRSGP
jgi:hypothetical protein